MMNTTRLFQLTFAFMFMGIIGTLLSTSYAASPTGAQQIYMPHIGRAEPNPSEFVGVFRSAYPSYPATPEPISEIYTVRGDGSDYTRLTDNNFYDLDPAWSPDGSMILWRQTDAAPGSEVTYNDLWLMNSDGTNQRPVATMEGSESGSWSPDGNHIGFYHRADTTPRIDFYITSPTTITPTLVMTDVFQGGEIWSPAGDYFALAVPVGAYVYDLYRFNVDGSNPLLLAEDIGVDSAAFYWSPDGTWLVYEKVVEENQDLYAVSVDGSETRRLTTDPAIEFFTAWVEGGAKLLVEEALPDFRSVTHLVTFADGTSTPFITNTTSQVWDVSPDGTKVAFLQVDQAAETLTVYIQATDSLTPTAVSDPLTCGGAACGLVFHGWASDSHQLAYAFYQTFTPTVNFSKVYVASIAGDTATYRLLKDNSGSGNAVWMPYGSWITAYSNDGQGFNLTLFNTRTGYESPLPAAQDGYLLFQPDWRYNP